MTRTHTLRRLAAWLSFAAAAALSLAILWPQQSVEAQRRGGRGLRCQVHLTQARVPGNLIERGLIGVAVLALRSSPVTMPNGFSCQPGCVLYPTVDLTVPGLLQWGDTVNPAWVGLCMYFQFVCWDRTQNCVDSSYGALQICFTT